MNNKKISGLAVLVVVVLALPVTYAANNISILYGWNGTSFVPVKLTDEGKLSTDINMTQSIGLSPSLNNTYDLGTAAMLWANLYARTIRSGGFLSIIGDTNVTGTFYAAGIVANLENSTGLTNVSLLYGVNQSNPLQQIPASLAANGAMRMSVEQASITTASGLSAGATGSDLTLDRINVTGTTANSTFSGDVRIFGTLYGGSPVKISGLNVTDGNLFVTGALVVNSTTITGASASGWTISGSNVYNDTANVGIGTASPLGLLHVKSTSTAIFNATGGTITYSDGYTIHTFTNSGTFTPNGNGYVEVLVVGGGGGGGAGYGGGGGAGGYQYNPSFLVGENRYNVIVGAGGAGGVAGGLNNGQNGSSSSFSTITALGGGGGGCADNNGLSGGSGGGAGCGYTRSGGNGTQGSNGGSSSASAPNYGSGGGGGANSTGISGTSTAGGNGGNGVTNNISGSPVTYAGGGGGGSYQGGTAGTGGLGGGGNGKNGDVDGSNGTANTGGGGGGAGYQTTRMAGGNGGSGIVIIRYPTNSIASLNDSLVVNSTTGKVGIGTTSPTQALTVVGSINVTGAAYGSVGTMTLLCSGSGTNTIASATNVATCTISGLTSSDRLQVMITHGSVTQATAVPSLYSVTDSVAIQSMNYGNALSAGVDAQDFVILSQKPQSTTTVMSWTNGYSTADGTRPSVGARVTFTTPWTGLWTLALRTGAGGVTAGGTYYWSWSVYKISGQ